MGAGGVAGGTGVSGGVTPKGSSMSSKSSCGLTPKKYGKEKLTKFKKGKEINFAELYEKINSIGT